MLAKAFTFSVLIGGLQVAMLKSQLQQHHELQILLDSLTNPYTSELHSLLSEIENITSTLPPNPMVRVILATVQVICNSNLVLKEVLNYVLLDDM